MPQAVLAARLHLHAHSHGIPRYLLCARKRDRTPLAHAVASSCATQRVPPQHFAEACLCAVPSLPACPSPFSTGKHYDARLDAQQRKLQDMAAEQEEWEQQRK